MLSRIAQLEKFCFRTGIFSNLNRNKNSNEENHVIIGPYGHLLLNQIKNEWVNSNMNKFENNFLVSSIDLLNETEREKKFDRNYFSNSIDYAFSLKQAQVGLVNVFQGKNSFQDTKESNLITRHQSLDLTYLNGFHFYENESFFLNKENKLSTDPYSFWQRERKVWWTRYVNNPENIILEQNKNKSNDEPNNRSSESFIGYESDGISHLENLIHLDLKYDKTSNLYHLLSDELQNKFEHLIITKTTSEKILENILLDSVDFNQEKVVFNLNFCMAPFKATILYESDGTGKNKNGDLYEMAKDLKKMLYLNRINVNLMHVKSEEMLDNAYERLDELGIPYSIYLPPNIKKNGICMVRNRDTTISEQTHLSHIPKQFASILTALSF